MPIEVSIVDGPLPAPSPGEPAAGVGARVVFEGIVRPLESGQVIDALDYQAYEPMASRLLHRLAEETLTRHGLTALRVQHSRGRVPVGGCSFRLTVESPHRAEGLAAMAEFIDRLKRDVPIWKSPVPVPADAPPGSAAAPPSPAPTLRSSCSDRSCTARSTSPG